MTDPIDFVGGGEIVQPFLVELENGAVPSLAGCTVTAEVWWGGKVRPAVMPLVTIEAEAPGIAEDAGDQIAHGRWTLDEVATALMPAGKQAFVRLMVVNSAGVTMHSRDCWLRRLG